MASLSINDLGGYEVFGRDTRLPAPKAGSPLRALPNRRALVREASLARWRDDLSYSNDPSSSLLRIDHRQRIGQWNRLDFLIGI